MFFVIYNTETGNITQTVSAPFYMPEMFVLEEGFAVLEVDKQPNDDKEHIKDGVLVAKPEPIIDPKVTKVLEQDKVWDSIKRKRLSQITNGVLVESVNKTFHTDSMSAIQYSTIAGMAAMGTYQTVNWKVMDNSWVLLTVELLKELQVAISVKTNTNYEVAEQHKAAMLLVDNPLEYDYSTNWV
ncbi:hypothetical protein Psyc_0442 [Psychrobacter arcticus 273-4]|uniref:DUF4376 domain-containing protein n=1 Tax=Psychrobacter arcticus (strain DSM 17307 / VKM B-2377 / 273-4) TaxID=259536 RepID=Q4FUK3_PSYA2|nr:DUF4376 domain-containing protein [Psychrobacter arcticus]AAZ18305.1 hypothetical protein Psyc_0442 [Psychrobacter arcticus 273-4]